MMLLASPAAAREPALAELLRGLPERGRLECTILKRTSPTRVDVAREVAPVRREMTRRKYPAEEARQRVDRERRLFERMRDGYEQRLERIHYWTPDRVRVIERLTPLDGGPPFETDRFAVEGGVFGLTRTLPEKPRLGGQTETDSGVRHGLLLEQVLVWGGYPLHRLVDERRATVSRWRKELVVEGPLRNDGKACWPRPQRIRMVFREKGPWIPIRMEVNRDARVLEKCLASGFRKFDGGVYPEKLTFDRYGTLAQVKSVTVRAMIVGDAVRDADLTPAMPQEVIVLDTRPGRTFQYTLHRGDHVPSLAELNARMAAAARPQGPPSLASGWLLVVRTCSVPLILGGALVLLRRRRAVEAPPGRGSTPRPL